MKTNYVKNTIKFGIAAMVFLAFGVANAQQTTGNFTKIEDAGKSKVLDGTIRVIDNKGTKKYLQVKNGLTLLTNQTPEGGIVSTWQLGGTITDNTYIDVDGKAFALDGLKLETGSASTDATDESDHGTGTGYTFLVRDEASGETRKLLAADLIVAISVNFTVLAPAAPATTPSLIIPATGLVVGMDVDKISIYRNGAKLVANVDYTGVAVVDEITLVENTTAPNDWSLMEGDLIEVQWVK